MKWMRSIKRRIGIRASLPWVILIFALGFVAGNLSLFQIAALNDSEKAIESFRDAFSIIESRYIDDVDVDLLVDGAIDGMVKALGDDHSGYIRPDLYTIYTDFSGEFTGIGVTVYTNPDNGEIEVLTVIPNSPAESVGVLPGDIFYDVDGIPVTGLSQADLTTLVPGPRGSSVIIRFMRDGELLTFEIIRDTFPLPNVSYEMVGDDIAHISMLDFNDLSRSQLDDALKAVDINETAGLIFDMRNNPGGTLDSAIEIGSAFIEDGVLLRQVARDKTEELTRSSGSYYDIKVPIVVLVNKASASAAEVIAGAMQDYGVATIIGERTFGKGTVQTIPPPLANGGGLRITVRRWLTPKGNWIHQQGITPDIIVKWDREANDESVADIQLGTAIEYLESLRD